MNAAWATVLALATVLGGCAALSQELRAPMPIGQSEVNSRQSAVGSKKWFDALGRASICADPALAKGCSRPKTGAATVVAVESVTHDFSQIRTVHAVYKVRIDGGKSGYISPIDFDTFMVAETKHRQDAAAKTDCDRRGGVRIGMTAAQVEASCWGKPQRINRTITAAGERQQWVYGGYQYLYLVDGVVTAIQSH